MVGGPASLSDDVEMDAVTRLVEGIAGGSRIRVWVVPGASRDQIVGRHGERLKVKTSAPAEGGRANQTVMKLLQEALGRPVELVSGRGSRSKVFEVEGLTPEEVLRNLGE
jgi:hypothetical protein